MKKKLLVLLVCTVMLMSACTAAPAANSGTDPAAETQAASNAPTASTGKTHLTVSTSSGEPANLHPYATATIGVKNTVAGTIFETLAAVSMDGKTLEPCLAEEWAYNDDNMGITFKLRHGVQFHDGEEMKASDVLFSIAQWEANPKVKSSVSSIDFANVKAIDDYTVYVPLTMADSSIVQNMADMQNMCVIIGKKSYESMGENFQNAPVGTGPYMFKEWMQGDRVELVRFDKYWAGTSALDGITIRYINELSQAMIELETGGVDAIMEANSTDVVRVQNNEVEGLKVISSPGSSLRSNNLNFNHKSTYMGNVLVRKAIACAIDKTAICKIIWPVEGTPNVSPLTADTWGFNAALNNDPYSYDVERAKTYMKEAGYESGFEATLLTDSRSYHVQTAEMVQNMLGALNITVKVETLELAAQKEQYLLKGEGYDMYLLDSVYSSLDPLYGLYRSSHPKFAKTDSSQYTYYTEDHAKEYGELLDQIMVEFDADKKVELTYQMQDLFLDDMVWVSICSKQALALATADLTGVCVRGNGQLAMNWQTHFE